MSARADEARDSGRSFSIRQRWVSLEEISPELIRAVLAAEDFGFFGHSGIDFGEMRAAVIDALRRFQFPRGASTVTMQLAKNLYLSESKNPWRKVREVVIARRLDKNLGKRRVLEIYLNIIEWGPGLFGAEAAARHYFGKSAGQLSELESALLAARIPRPLADHTSPALRRHFERKASVIRKRAQRITLPAALKLR